MQFMKKFFALDEKLTLSNLQHEKQRVSEGLLEYIRRFRDLSLLCYDPVEQERQVDVCIMGMLCMNTDLILKTCKKVRLHRL